MEESHLDKYIALLQKLDLHYQAMRQRRIYSLTDFLRNAHQERRDTWRDYGEELFSYIGPLPGGAQAQFVRWVEIGGECFLLQGQNSLTKSFLSVKLAKACFNVPDEIIESENGLIFKKKDTRTVENEFRKRFFSGIKTQRSAYKLLKAKFFNIAGIPNVIYMSDDPPVYSILEWIDGETFSSYVRNNFSVRDNKRIKRVILAFWRILRLFQLLHRYNIVHRDVKPQNIIVNYQDQMPYLIDFSLTKDLQDSNRSVNTTDDSYLGDILYSPPEQIYHGNSALATCKSDVYSLGWFLYFIYTRKHPPRNIQQKILRTNERLQIPSVFRSLFIDATRESMELRPDIDDFIMRLEEIYHAEGLYFDDDLFSEVNKDDNAKTQRNSAVQNNLRFEQRLDALEKKIAAMSVIILDNFPIQEEKSIDSDEESSPKVEEPEIPEPSFDKLGDNQEQFVENGESSASPGDETIINGEEDDK